MSYRGSHIGTLIKPHGFRGDMFLKGRTEILTELETGMPLFIEKDGQRIPFFIEEIETDDAGGRCIVRFGFIGSDAEARRFVGCQVFDRLVPDKRDVLVWSHLHEYIGFVVTDTRSENQYRVTDFMDNQENPLLIIDKEGVEVMLPVNADYILSVDSKKKMIVAAFPDGLI